MKRDLEEIWEKIGQLPLCQTKVSLIEEGIALADTLNDLRQGYDLRLELVNSANFTGDNDKSLVAFAWLLAISDRHPEEFPESLILWRYKWMITNLLDFPSISRTQIEETLNDLAIRFEREEPSKKPVLALKSKVAREFSDWDELKRLLPLWRKAPRVGLSDCLACDCNSMAIMNCALKRYKSGLKIAQPILTGKMWCKSVPHGTYAYFLHILVRLGDRKEALRFHELGYPLIKDNSGHLVDLASHLFFLVLIENFPKATQVFKRHLGLALASRVPNSRFWFFRASLFLLRQLDKKKTSKINFHFPGLDLPWDEQAKDSLPEILHWLEQETRTIASQFDARNGNTFRTGLVDELAEWESQIQPLD